jgi:hypothetical protein
MYLTFLGIKILVKKVKHSFSFKKQFLSGIFRALFPVAAVLAVLVHGWSRHQAVFDILPVVMGSDLAQPLEPHGLASRTLHPNSRRFAPKLRLLVTIT